MVPSAGCSIQLLLAATLFAGLPVVSLAQSAWEAESSGTTAELRAIIWTGEQFLAMGSGQTYLTSPDGVHWKAQAYPNTIRSSFQAVTWTGKEWIAVGNDGISARSTNGVSWRSLNTGTAKRLYAIASNGKRTVAVGEDGLILSYDPESVAVRLVPRPGGDVPRKGGTVDVLGRKAGLGRVWRLWAG